MSYNIAEILRYAAFTKDGTGGNPAGVVLDASGFSYPPRIRKPESGRLNL